MFKAVSGFELRRRGCAEDDIALARTSQDADRRAGQPARPRPSAAVDDLTARQLRRRGSCSQAALIADQANLAEKDPDRAAETRYHAQRLKAPARTPHKPGFYGFGGGNVSLGHQFIDTVQARLLQSGATPAQRDAAMATLVLIVRHLGCQSYACEKAAADLAAMRGVAKPHISSTLGLLERIGAISRVKRGRTKVIIVTPEGAAFWGDVNRHVEAVDRCPDQVVQLRPEPRPPNDPDRPADRSRAQG